MLNKSTEGAVLSASRIILGARFLKTQDFQKIFFTARSPNRATVKHYRFNDRRVVYVTLIAFQIRTYVTKESNTFRQLFA